MHILELPSFFPPYGGLFVLDQSKALARQGNTVRIAANVNISARLSPRLYFRAHTSPHKVVMDGIEVMRKEFRGIPFFPKACVTRWVKATEGLVDKYVENYGVPDIIHAHCCLWAGCAAMKAAAKYGVPYVVTEHLSSEIVLRDFGDADFLSWACRLAADAYRNAALVIPVSAELVADLAPLYGTDYRWEAVSNTIDTDFFSYKRRSDMRGRDYRLCCIANFVQGKGYDVLFDALGRYRRATGDNVRLTVAGRFTDSAGARALAADRGVGDIVDFCGEVDKNGVLRILHDSDCLLLATRREAQGLVLLEAMATGIPAVTTDCVPSSVRIPGGCHIVPTDNAAEMAEKLLFLRRGNINDCPEASAAVAALASPEMVGKRLHGLFTGILCPSR